MWLCRDSAGFDSVAIRDLKIVATIGVGGFGRVELVRVHDVKFDARNSGRHTRTVYAIECRINGPIYVYMYTYTAILVVYCACVCS